MKNFNKHILEAIRRGINLALDDYEEEPSGITPQKDMVHKNELIHYSFEYEQLKKKMDTLTEAYYFKGGPQPKISKEEYFRFVELSNILKVKYQYIGKYQSTEIRTNANLKTFLHNIEYLLNDGEPFTKFETDLNWIDTSKETSFYYLFENSNFNCDISDWDTSNVTNMAYTFRSCTFNKDISKWDVSKVENMSAMFRDSNFNQPIGNWDVSNVKNMYYMFENSDFNQDISGWNVSNVITTGYMFAHTNFNQDISGWNVSNVKNMLEMFNGNHEFKYDLSKWDVSNVLNYTNFFDTGAHFPKSYRPKFKRH